MTATLPTCPREDCTFTGPHHDHDKRTGKVRDRAEVAGCGHWETANYTRCYAPRTPQPQPAAVVLPTVDEVARVIPEAWANPSSVGSVYLIAAQAVLDLVAARLPVWQPVERGTVIDPADVRVGDRVEARWRCTDDDTDQIHRFTVASKDSVGSRWTIGSTDGRHYSDATLYLLDRPDPTPRNDCSKCDRRVP